MVIDFAEKKSQLQNVSPCRFRKSVYESDVQSGPGSSPRSFRMFRTVWWLTSLISSFPQLSNNAGLPKHNEKRCRISAVFTVRNMVIEMRRCALQLA